MDRKIIDKKKRKEIEEYIIEHIKVMEPTGYNEKIYREKFKKMNDEEFTSYMKGLKENKQTKFFLYVPPKKVNLKNENLIKAAKILDVKLSERLRMKDPRTGRVGLTPNSYSIYYLPVRRLKQYLMSKLSVPEGDTKLDLYTGQVVKPDKGSSISMVEAQILYSKGLWQSLRELTNVRGGNIAAYGAMKGIIEETGSISLDEIGVDSAIRSAAVAETYLKAMHIDNNLSGQTDQ